MMSTKLSSPSETRHGHEPGSAGASGRRYHALFSSPHADIVLRSREDTFFRVPSFTLRATSGHFRGLLSQSQSPNLSTQTYVQQPHEHVLEIDEPDLPMYMVLCMLSGLAYPPFASLRVLEIALGIADRWDAPGPMAIMRAYVASGVFLSSSFSPSTSAASSDSESPTLTPTPPTPTPGSSSSSSSITDANNPGPPSSILLYALASKYAWEEEAELFASLTLSLDIFHEIYRAELEAIPAKSLMQLLRLRRRRRDAFMRKLDAFDPCDPEGTLGPLTCTVRDRDRTHSNSTLTGPSYLPASPHNAAETEWKGCTHPVDHYPWRGLKSRMFLEMDQRPSGETMCGLDMEEWPEAIACWEARCDWPIDEINAAGGKERVVCGRMRYDKMKMLRWIRECVDGIV